MRSIVKDFRSSSLTAHSSRRGTVGLCTLTLISAFQFLVSTELAWSQAGKAEGPVAAAPAVSASPTVSAPGAADEGKASQPPLCDSACVMANMDRASRGCARGIEAKAPNDFEWIQRPGIGIFQEAEMPPTPTSSIVTYQGDSIRFLSAQREWFRVSYDCQWDASAGKVMTVSVRLGILGKPNAIAISPAAGSMRPPAEQNKPSAANVPPPKAAPAAETTFDKRRVGEFSEIEFFQVKSKLSSVQ